MSEMQSDTADVAMDTESNDDMTQSSDVMADENLDSAADQQQQQLFTSEMPDVGSSSVDEVRTESDAGESDAVDDAASSSRELDDGTTHHLPTADIDTDSENHVNIASTDEAGDGDNVSTNIPTPTAASVPSSASASVSSAVHGIRFTS